MTATEKQFVVRLPEELRRAGIWRALHEQGTLRIILARIIDQPAQLRIPADKIVAADVCENARMRFQDRSVISARPDRRTRDSSRDSSRDKAPDPLPG